MNEVVLEFGVPGWCPVEKRDKMEQTLVGMDQMEVKRQMEGLEDLMETRAPEYGGVSHPKLLIYPWKLYYYEQN